MQSLPVILGLLLGSAVLIYLSCEFFVNGVEWVGRQLAVGQKATGTILAALGTALPESVVTFVAVALPHSPADKDIGVGAAMGGPLVLGTIAYAVVGVTLWACRRRLPAGEEGRALYAGLSRDQAWFIVISVIKLAAGLIAFAFKPWLGVLFLAAYAAYAWKEMRGDQALDDEALEPLKLMPGADPPPVWASLLQTCAALVVIFMACRFFVGQLEALSPHLGLKPQLLSLLISPIATELPETLNAVIWIRQGKVRLALANISGAMMIQATVPTAFGLFATPWLLDPSLAVAGAVTLLSVSVLCLAFWRGWITRGHLAWMGLFYALFAGLLAGLHLWWPQMAAAKAEGHALYVKMRALPPDSPEYAQLMERQRALYSAATAGRWADVGGESGPNAGSNRARHAASDITDPDQATSWKSTSTQGPPGLSTAEAARSNSTAGRLSQSTNVMEGSLPSQDGGLTGKAQGASRPKRQTGDSIIAADPELKALAEDTAAFAEMHGVEEAAEARNNPNTIAEAVRAAAVCMFEEGVE